MVYQRMVAQRPPVGAATIKSLIAQQHPQAASFAGLHANPGVPGLAAPRPQAQANPLMVQLMALANHLGGSSRGGPAIAPTHAVNPEAYGPSPQHNFTYSPMPIPYPESPGMGFGAIGGGGFYAPPNPFGGQKPHIIDTFQPYGLPRN